MVLSVVALALALALTVFWPSPGAARTDRFARLPAFESLVRAPLDDPGPKVVFKWQDDTGAWHYGDSPPENQTSQALTLPAS